MFVRIGRSKDSPELAARLGDRARLCFSEDLAASATSARALRQTLDAAPVIASTAHRASTHPYVRGRMFEITLVDEASQLTEPLTLGLVMRAPRFVLIGDDRQLPPVVRGKELAISMFERLKGIAEREAPEPPVIARPSVPDASIDHGGFEPALLRRCAVVGCGA